MQAAIQLLRDEMIAAAQSSGGAGVNQPQSVGMLPAVVVQPGHRRVAAVSFRPGLERAATIGPRSDGGGMAEFGAARPLDGPWTPPASIDEARARARERFKSRLESGEQIGQCGCGEGDAVLGLDDASPPECVVGVRFRDSGRIYYFRPRPG